VYVPSKISEKSCGGIHFIGLKFFHLHILKRNSPIGAVSSGSSATLALKLDKVWCKLLVGEPCPADSESGCTP